MFPIDVKFTLWPLINENKMKKRRKREKSNFMKYNSLNSMTKYFQKGFSESFIKLLSYWDHLKVYCNPLLRIRNILDINLSLMKWIDYALLFRFRSSKYRELILFHEKGENHCNEQIYNWPSSMYNITLPTDARLWYVCFLFTQQANVVHSFTAG